MIKYKYVLLTLNFKHVVATNITNIFRLIYRH
jgi:hypothetical protein